MATQVNEVPLKSCHRLLENNDPPAVTPLSTCETLQGISLLQIRAECRFLQGQQTSYFLKIINSLLGQDPAMPTTLECLTQAAKEFSTETEPGTQKAQLQEKGEENCHKYPPHFLPAPSCHTDMESVTFGVQQGAPQKAHSTLNTADSESCCSKGCNSHFSSNGSTPDPSPSLRALRVQPGSCTKASSSDLVPRQCSNIYNPRAVN